jgi:hypothetical protein
MGLDMYLSRRIYIGSKYEHREVKAEIDITIGGVKVDVDTSKLQYIYLDVAYWRKANHIHGWFVEKFAGGRDECQQIYVPTEGLKELLEICRNLLGSRNEEMAKILLPPCEGFFFGGSNIDEYYWQTIEETEALLEEILGTHVERFHEYIYQASW